VGRGSALAGRKWWLRPVTERDGDASERAPARPLALTYPKPAERWVEALPLGNGRLGAMVFGGVASERLQLNEDTLWSGARTDTNTPGARAVLPELRAAIFAGKYEDADRLARGLQGPFTQSYKPLADLGLSLSSPGGDVVDYARDLDLDTAVATTRFRAGVTTVVRGRSRARRRR